MEILLAAAFLMALFLLMSLRVLKTYERMTIMRFGRFVGVRGPGVIFLIPFIDGGWRFDTRLQTFDVPEQHLLTKDNVTLTVSATCIWEITDPTKSQSNLYWWINQHAQQTLCRLVGQNDLNTLLSERELLEAQLQGMIGKELESFGGCLHGIYLKKILLPPQLQAAMAKEAIAERERRARIIAAEGEALAAEKLSRAAAILASEGTSMQLRFLQSAEEIAAEECSTLIFPIPWELADPYFERVCRNKLEQQE